jgi:vacuolar-type H+-ATPase subunit E/Vma4
MNELGNLADKEALSEYLRGIGDQLEDALLTVDTEQYRRKLLRVSEDVKELFESLRVDKREAHREAFNSFFNAVSESIKKIYTSPLMKFILLRRLLGLRG